MLTAVYIILGIILFPFIFHFVSLMITIPIKRKRNNWKDVLFRTKRFEGHLTFDKSMMLSHHHYSEMYFEDYSDGVYTKEICLTIGGLYLVYKYGFEFAYVKNDDSKSKYFGFYSVDGEWIWRTFWSKHLHDNPLLPQKHIGTYDFDMDTNRMIDSNVFRSYSKQYNPDMERPYVSILKDTIYVNKMGELQNMNEIKFWITEMRYTLPLLHALHLDKLYQKTYVHLNFDSDTGLGVESGSWKGGVLGSAMNLTLHYPELLKLYKKYRRGKCTKEQFQLGLNKRISDFMTTDKEY